MSNKLLYIHNDDLDPEVGLGEVPLILPSLLGETIKVKKENERYNVVAEDCNIYWSQSILGKEELFFCKEV